MNNTRLNQAFTSLYTKLAGNGYHRYAEELLSAVTTESNPIEKMKYELDRINREKKENENKPNQSIYKDQPGGVAPILELSRIFTHIAESPSFNNLPINVQKGITQINKSTENAFRFASEKEALFGFGGKSDSLDELKKLLLKYDKTGPDPRKVPEEITKAVDNLNMLVDKAIASRPKEKTLGEKGKDLARGVAEKGQDIARGIGQKGQDIAKGVAEKGQDIARGVAEKGMGVARGVAEKGKDIARGVAEKREQQEAIKNQTNEREQESYNNLKNDLANDQKYKSIFYKLPPQIIKMLNNIGLGLDDLNSAATAKVAHHINNTLLNYFTTRKAYSSKELSKGKKKEKKVYETVSKKLKKDKKVTTDDIATMVAKERLKKDPEYYSKLKEKAKSKEGMDFSGISQMIKTDKALDERELARVIRLSIAAEHDATHLYELIADCSDDEDIKKVFQDIADEEKIHVGEFEALLSKYDKEDSKFLEEGKKEIEDLIK